MLTKFNGYFVLFVFLSLLIISCSISRHSKSSVELAMKYYDHLIQRSNADSISLLYAPDGNLGDIAFGRDSIRNFLSSFKKVRVLSQVSTTQSIVMLHDTALQKGSYRQSDILSEKDTVHVKGEYFARWEWMNKSWHIKKMTTKPIR